MFQENPVIMESCYRDKSRFHFDNDLKGIQIEITNEETPYNEFSKLWDNNIMEMILTSINSMVFL